MTNKILLSFGLALVGEILLAWLESSVRNIANLIVAERLAPFMALLGLPLMGLAVWKGLRDRKRPYPFRYWTGAYLFIPALLFTLTSLVMCYDVTVAIHAMYVIFPCAAGLDLIYELYQRPCFLSCLYLLGTGAGLWLLTRLENTDVVVRLAGVCAIPALVCTVLAAVLKRKDGALGCLRLLPEGSEYGALLATAFFGLLCFAGAIFLPMLVSAALIRYLVYVVLAYALCLLGYFTVKLM